MRHLTFNLHHRAGVGVLVAEHVRVPGVVVVIVVGRSGGIIRRSTGVVLAPAAVTGVAAARSTRQVAVPVRRWGHRYQPRHACSHRVHGNTDRRRRDGISSGGLASALPLATAGSKHWVVRLLISAAAIGSNNASLLLIIPVAAVLLLHSVIIGVAGVVTSFGAVGVEALRVGWPLSLDCVTGGGRALWLRRRGEVHAARVAGNGDQRHREREVGVRWRRLVRSCCHVGRHRRYCSRLFLLGLLVSDSTAPVILAAHVGGTAGGEALFVFRRDELDVAVEICYLQMETYL